MEAQQDDGGSRKAWFQSLELQHWRLTWETMLSRSTQRPSTVPFSRSSFTMPCQSKLCTFTGRPGSCLRTERTPSEKCSDSSSSSFLCTKSSNVVSPHMSVTKYFPQGLE